MFYLLKHQWWSQISGVQGSPMHKAMGTATVTRNVLEFLFGMYLTTTWRDAHKKKNAIFLVILLKVIQKKIFSFEMLFLLDLI